MEKRIFSTETPSDEPEIQPKKEFIGENIAIEEERVEDTKAELIIEQGLKPSRFWVRLLLGAFLLLTVAVFAQSIQWLFDTWQQHQWIYFAFAVGFFCISLAGVGAIISEWKKLIYLRKHQKNQQESELLLNTPSTTSGHIATKFCKNILKTLPITEQKATHWQNQLDEAYNAEEIFYLFNQDILKPLDNKVKQLISKSACENAIIVAVSPVAIIDVLMVAWRNIALVNQITQVYGMELGYFSRLKLFKMVLTNMVFAGATEIASDIGMDYFSQNLTAKISMRAAQGIGIGLISARLGIKAMEFCRPVALQPDERPKLSVVRQELLSTIKTTLFSSTPQKESQTISK
ncbi:TIGR01620 family protein [Pasteurella skyensis]|uniref:TIGR01620 family protein n=1 Tax=Phocoenobacter skyensis TaxID=97481 RepID=UPI002761AAAC|nr:TIGR01620 family protein [Pasteurella skyensis]MDP8176083.1 TIGR01620 family protein [Pasteurella skyensis]MDP8198682.1 TIGR01620 family protein [Pasteurella skyensis]